MDYKSLIVLERCLKLKDFLENSLNSNRDKVIFNFHLLNQNSAELVIDLTNKKYVLAYWYRDLFDRGLYHESSKILAGDQLTETLRLVEDNLQDKAIVKLKKDIESERLEKENRELGRKLDTILSRMA